MIREQNDLSLIKKRQKNNFLERECDRPGLLVVSKPDERDFAHFQP